MIAYTKRSITPSSQLDSPSPTTCETMSDDVKVMTVSKLPKKRSSPLSMPQLTRTITGMTKRAICVDEPSATPKARSILPLAAMTIAVECSAALPMMGRMTKPTKDSERPRPAAAPWIEPVSSSERKAIATVARPSQSRPPRRLKMTSSSSSSSSAAPLLRPNSLLTLPPRPLDCCVGLGGLFGCHSCGVLKADGGPSLWVTSWK
mmetsp:Transcript_19873/g.50238  ORF Transcript_19873/g.50238 Transcript_19873/m.50238 type:complete len:205 (-) Transcript_19873:609-1223(-)